MKSMKWTSNLPKEEVETFEKKLKGSKEVLRRLLQLVEEEYRVSDKEMHKRENFFMPAWAEKQAYELGYQKFAQKMINLLKE